MTRWPPRARSPLASSAVGGAAVGAPGAVPAGGAGAHRAAAAAERRPAGRECQPAGAEGPGPDSRSLRTVTGSHPAYVLLEDGTWYRGATGAPFDVTTGEVVFTTNLSGYQEVFTDPSYAGQIVVMTAPMIGNYGVNGEDLESRGPTIAGVVVRELSQRASSWRATARCR